MLLSAVGVALLSIVGVPEAVPLSEDGELVEREMASAPKRVAIIGGGAAGSSAAYYLAQNAQDADIPTEIHVYERDSQIGGRSTTVNAWNDPSQPVELGASIFVDVNHILVAAKKAFNLSTAIHETYTDEGRPGLGVWNGKEFVFMSSEKGGWWDMAKLLWRYGYAPIKTNGLMKSTVGKFLSMYDEPLFPWKSLSEVVHEVGLVNTTAVHGEEFLKNNGVSDKFASEIVQASTRVNYASDLVRIHGVETMVCMATNGAMAIAGGNWQIFENMVKSSPCISTHLNTTITHISKQPDGTYNLSTSAGEVSAFDDVVLAAPLQFSRLIIDPPPKHTPDQIPYVKLYVTLFATPYPLHPGAFNLEEGQKVPQYVLTTLPSGEQYDEKEPSGSPGFFSISITGTGINTLSSPPRKEYIHKIFSDRRIDSSFLSPILGRKITDDEAEHGVSDGAISWIYHKIWHSYPKEIPRVTFEEIQLDDGFWYTSGIESFISTMETSALAGKNVAQLIVNDWKNKKATKQDGETLKVQGDPNWKYEGIKPGQEQKPLKAKL